MKPGNHCTRVQKVPIPADDERPADEKKAFLFKQESLSAHLYGRRAFFVRYIFLHERFCALNGLKRYV